MTDHDHRSNPDYRRFIRAVRRHIRSGHGRLQGDAATMHASRFRKTARLGFTAKSPTCAAWVNREARPPRGLLRKPIEYPLSLVNP